jgi:hypothetical protein
LHTIVYSAGRRVARVGPGWLLVLVITGMVAACNDASSSESGLSESEPGPSESGPGLSALAAASHRVAVAYLAFSQTACNSGPAKTAATEADVPACLAAASELRRQIQAPRREVIAIEDAGSDACKRSADGYDIRLQSVEWALMTLHRELVAGHPAGPWPSIVGERYGVGGGPIYECLSSSEPGESTSGLGKMNDDNHQADVAFNKYDTARLVCGGRTRTFKVECVDAAFATVDLKQKLETLLLQVVTVGKAASSVTCRLAARAYSHRIRMELAALRRHGEDMETGGYFGESIAGRRTQEIHFSKEVHRARMVRSCR